jgi:hypothetical protein
MDRGNKYMIRYIAALMFFCLASYAYSIPACDELGAQGESGNAKESFWGSFFGGSSSAGDLDCEPAEQLGDKSDVDAGVYSDDDKMLRTLIAEGQLQLDQALKDYKDKTAEEMVAFDHDITVLKNQSLEIRRSVEVIKARNAQKLSDLSEAQLSNAKLIQTADRDLKLLIEDLSERLNSVVSGLERAENDLANKVENNRQETNKSVAELDRLVSDNVLYLIISIVAVLLISSLIFYFLRKKISVQGVDLTGSLVDTRKSLEEEFVKLDGKLVEILEAQIEVSESEPNSSGEDVDHSLVIKVADEIVRIQKNITRMDEKTKGLKQLSASVTRIQDNVASNGYEIVEMLGMPYNEGMKVSATFVPDEDLEAGAQMITRVIKPQINYQGVMIQSAQIEVSQGE